MDISFAVKIVTIIVKSAANSKIGSELGKELIGASIDGVSERSIAEINNFIRGKKSKLEHILSEENMKKIYVAEEDIDFVVAELKDLLSKIKITDTVFRECRYNPENLKDFLWSEYSRSKNIIENESDIKTGLYAVAETLIELMRESEEFKNNLLIQISNSIDDANVELQKISDYMHKNSGSIDKEIQMILVTVQMILEQIQKNDSREGYVIHEEKFKNNKKQDYINNWNSRLFLHLDNDENPIMLADAFIIPDFEMHNSVKRIGFSDEDTMEQILEKFIQYTRTSTMLITGVPGMGKTTITSWLANKYETDDNVIILRFRDWEREELNQGLLKAIIKILECKKKDLENRVLILDGLDEMKALDIRDSVLSEFVSELKDFDNFKCVITSRPAYIDAHYFQNIIEIKQFDLERVDKFYEKITGKVLDKKEIIKSNLEVLGIPVILYMAIMSDIDISENSTKPELYSRIFGKKGGIFDKFCDGETQYGSGEQILRNPENITKYLEFLNDTAFRMLEKHKLGLEKHECKDIRLEFKKKEVSVLEFPIKHLFEDTANNIEFVHKSIYEYFVSEYIFCKIESTIKENESKEELAGVFGGVLKSDILSDEILEFLKYKMTDIFDAVKEAFQLMLQDGMTYYMKERCKNVVECEMNVFVNMLEIIHLFENSKLIKLSNSISRYIGYNRHFGLNLDMMVLGKMNLGEAYLRGANLIGADLREADLGEADLIGVDLRGADLREADLVGADLVGADLREADLRRADLREADLREADLRGADLIGADLREADLVGADLRGVDLGEADLRGVILDEKQIACLEKGHNLYETMVYIKEKNEIISYEEYCSGRS